MKYYSKPAGSHWNWDDPAYEDLLERGKLENDKALLEFWAGTGQGKCIRIKASGDRAAGYDYLRNAAGEWTIATGQPPVPESLMEMTSNQVS